MSKFIFFTSCLILFAGPVSAQSSKNMAVYMGYAFFNEPHVTFEYRFHPRLAANVEAAAFAPFVHGMSSRGLFPEFWYRLNGVGGSLRGGVALYGKRHFGIMHRLMLDLTYFSSYTYQEEVAVQYATLRDFRREFVQSTVCYELTFRLAKDKRHHLFLRAGIGPRFLWTTVTQVQYPGYPAYDAHDRTFSVTAAPVFSVGYRIRLFPQKGYFVREGL